MVTLNKLSLHTLVFCFLLTSFACKKLPWFKDDELTIKKTNYTGTQLKLNGYYYQLVNSTMYGVYCFYSNGVIQHLGDGYKISDTFELEKSFRSQEWVERNSDVKYTWGAFLIEGNNIQFERWYPSEAPYKAYVRIGNIINDTTFRIAQSYRWKKGKKTEVRNKDETYHFKRFSPKPDSTNSFVN